MDNLPLPVGSVLKGMWSLVLCAPTPGLEPGTFAV